MENDNQDKPETPLDIIKRSIGRRVYVTSLEGYYCNIVGVKDEYTFVVKDDLGKTREVNCFDIRYF